MKKRRSRWNAALEAVRDRLSGVEGKRILKTTVRAILEDLVEWQDEERTYTENERQLDCRIDYKPTRLAAA